MARNDQLTRQWHLLRRLESPRGATLRERAVGLPDDFPEHLRTLRRDLAAVEAPPAHPASVADAAWAEIRERLARRSTTVRAPDRA